LRGGFSAGFAPLSGGGASLTNSAPVSPGRDPAIGAAAAAAAAVAAAGDAGSQARHLTVLVHRLQSRPGEDVLAELAACAGTMCKQAWVDNFSKVIDVFVAHKPPLAHKPLTANANVCCAQSVVPLSSMRCVLLAGRGHA
jgi:hypothetical protein